MKKRQRTRLLFLLLFASVLLWAPPATESQTSIVPDTGTWITLGADAFEVLRHSGVRFQGSAARVEAELSGVVLTRVDRDALQRVSMALHEELRRCPGFMVHGSRDQAYLALQRSRTGGYRGTSNEYVINQATLVQDLESRIEKARILETIEHLSTEYTNRYYLHPSGVQSTTWIRDRWQSFAQGRPDVTVELYDHGSWAQPSVILTIQGSSLPSEVIVLGGHLDSVAPGSSNPDFSAPGADDNASGIAVLTEVIRVAMAANFRPQRTVKLMGYAAEEVGLLGSQEIAEEFRDASTEVVAVLQLDMTDFFGSAQDIAFLSDFTNNELTVFAKSLVDTYQPELEWTDTACGYACSDHASWHLEGYPTVMPAEAIFGQHNPWIHTTSDIVANLGNNADHAYKFARLAAALMVEVGVVDVGELFTDGFESGDPSAWSSSIP